MTDHLGHLTTRELMDEFITAHSRRGVNVMHENRPWTVLRIELVIGGIRVSLFPNGLPDGHAGLGTTVRVAMNSIDRRRWEKI